MNSENKKNIIKVIAFIIIGILIFNFVSTILLPEWITGKDVSLGIRGFYLEEENSIDVIFVGDSNIYRGISPMVIWQNYGIPSYAYSTPEQRLWVSYYMIRECFKTQTPKTICLEMNEAFNESNIEESNVRKALDNMKWSTNKWDMINDETLNFSKFDKLSYVFPILRYHSKWSSLTVNDFYRIDADYDAKYKGYVIAKKSQAYTNNSDYMQEKNESISIGERASKYLDKIKEICDENGTELILITMPSPRTWSEAKNQAAKEYAKQKNLKFIDLNENGVVNIDWTIDTNDWGYHLNEQGAKKVSKYLGEYLKNNCNYLTDKRNNEEYQSWNEDEKTYEDEVKNRKE